MDLLWFMLMWHALAKLRLHTQTTVNLLEGTTTSLGRAVRKFARSVEDIETYELPKEHAARKRREAAQSQATGSAATSTFLGRKIKKFSLLTFKWHDLGHLVRDIVNFGTSDVYSTQAVSIPCLISCLWVNFSNFGCLGRKRASTYQETIRWH